MVLSLKTWKSRSLPGLPRTLLLDTMIDNEKRPLARAAVSIRPTEMPVDVCGAALRKPAVAVSPPRRLFWWARRFPHGMFIVGFHLVYAGVLVYLLVKHAGHVVGLDTWAESLQFVKEHPGFKPLVA